MQPSQDSTLLLVVCYSSGFKSVWSLAFVQLVTFTGLDWWMPKPWWKRQRPGSRCLLNTSVRRTRSMTSGNSATVYLFDHLCVLLLLNNNSCCSRLITTFCCFVSVALTQMFFLRLINPEKVLRSVYKSSGCSAQRLQRVVYLEHVVVRITITHPHRGDLSIILTSPAGTRSQLLANRYKWWVQLGCKPINKNEMIFLIITII